MRWCRAGLNYYASHHLERQMHFKLFSGVPCKFINTSLTFDVCILTMTGHSSKETIVRFDQSLKLRLLSIYLSIYLSATFDIYSSFRFIILYQMLRIYLSIYLSIWDVWYQFIKSFHHYISDASYLSIYLSIWDVWYQFIKSFHHYISDASYLSINLSVCLYFNFFPLLSVIFSLSLSLSPSLFTSSSLPLPSPLSLPLHLSLSISIVSIKSYHIA